MLKTSIFIIILIFSGNLFSDDGKWNVKKSITFKYLLKLINENEIKNYDKESIIELLNGVEIQHDVLKKINCPAEHLPWYKYDKLLITNKRINSGKNFLLKNINIFKKIHSEYNVDPFIINAIIGIESFYGEKTGKFPVLDTLVTLIEFYPKRRDFFKKELYNFLLLVNENNLEIKSIKGSYAGAMGAIQFIPSSFRKFAVDFDGDGKIDIWNNTGDILASVANYFKENNWEAKGRIMQGAFFNKKEKAKLLKTNLNSLKPNTTFKEIVKLGAEFHKNYSDDVNVVLLKYKENINTNVYFIGFHNFYVITQYNYSKLYARAIFELAKETEHKTMSKLTEKINKKTKELFVKKHYLSEISPLKKSYRLGDSGYEVKKIEEWLMLWQLNQNYSSIVLHITPDQKFDKDTENVLKNVQEFLGIEKTGVVDFKTWEALVYPLKKSFSLNSYNKKELSEKMKYYASKHLQFRSSELEENNEGPWIRSYMDDHEGKYYYWCAGFVSTILDQTFSSIGEYFDEHYANSWLVEDHRNHAKIRKLLVTHEDLKSGKYLPKPGDMAIYISNNRAHHIEIVYEILDMKKGIMRTIGGNTNFSGSSNGVGTFIVDRNFMNSDVEIIKLIDNEKINEHKNMPEYARKLLKSYPNQIIDFKNNKLIFHDGTFILYDDYIKKTLEKMLENASIKNQSYFKYNSGKINKKINPYEDPGRITSQDFFKKIYGNSKKIVEKKLEEFIWAPNFGGQKLKATTINGISSKLKKIGEELDDDPEMEPFLTNIGGTYKWREVSGTNRLSLHSFGIAIDLNVSQSSYWQWDCKCKNEKKILAPYKNKIPQKIIDTFEKYGFIWGGKWYHYDTMHFEYRPDLIN